VSPARPVPRIISVSRRSDIPAFYMPWFMQRLAEGKAAYRNPFFPGNAPIAVSLKPQDIAAWVFWSKNFTPFLEHAQTISAMDKPALFHFTINNYPKALEPLRLDAETLADTCRHLGEYFDPRGVIWRYDPVIISSITPLQWHRENFAMLARKLEGSTSRVITSVVSMYRKTRRRLHTASVQNDFTVYEPTDTELTDLLSFMKHCAADHGMTLKVCSSPRLESLGFSPTACIDPVVLVQMGMPKAYVPKAAPTREGCRCVEVRDIGAYDTCPGGCFYCYAVNNHDTAVSCFRKAKKESLTII